MSGRLSRTMALLRQRSQDRLTRLPGGALTPSPSAVFEGIW
jgi:hypothetical protein